MAIGNHGARMQKGFTLLELLITISIVAILGAIAWTGYGRMKEKARKATCISHLRSFHTALSSAIQENGEWPQIPLDDGSDWSEEKFYEWWFNTLKPYGITEHTWVCPSDKQSLEVMTNRKAESEDNPAYAGSYVPSNFDKGATTPFRINQPWMLERGNFHKTGSHILMPDGSVSAQLNAFPGR